MRHRRYSLICPQCAHVQVVVRDSLLIANMNPVAEEKMDEEIYFQVTCRQCGYKYELESELSYQNLQRKFMLFLHMPQAKKQEGFTCLAVSSASSFYLARRILKAGLDVSGVLAKIAALKQKGYEQVRFLEYDAKNQLLWFEADQVSIAVKM
jgi:predicted nucleic-acid-binding Zn-ribbon protein